MVHPKVLVTRLIPDAGLALIKNACDAEIWLDPLPPPVAVLQAGAGAASHRL